MIFFKRFFLILSVTVFGISSLALAQDDSTQVDSNYESYIKNAWDEVEMAWESDGVDADSLQRQYANEFYDYYLKNQHTETGESAFQSAFMMWGNIGDPTKMDEALETLDNDSHLWSKVINSVGNIYAKNEELGGYEAYLEQLDKLKDQLTHPESKSAVILSLMRASKDDNKEKAKRLAQQLVEIDAKEFFVDQGLGYLHEYKSLNIGQEAPEFTAKTIGRKEISLSDMDGQYVLLDFWATWCGPCLPEIPHLKTLWDRFGDKNFNIIGISLDRQKSDLTAFLEEKKIDWPQVLETEGWDGEITKLYNVVGIPRTYLLNPQGEIIAKDLRGEEMIKEIDRYMSK